MVAITLTGLILGGGALLLMEMTEGLGCLFGGFCIAMWLLVLQPGGLLTTTAPIVVFIVFFTMIGWATSFSRFTRPYGLICLTSFGGATVAVLGIDCFTKSGLKEFWAYIWNLNQNLFPLGATTYPLTKGMKVEIAAIIVIFLAGMASQSKLWKAIKKRRERRALDRLHGERSLRQEEEKVGRRVGHATSRKRVYWESVYGNRDLAHSADFGNGSIAKDANGSTVTSTEHSVDRELEMNEISTSHAVTGAGSGPGAKVQESAVVVRVVADEQPAPDMLPHHSTAQLFANRLSPEINRSSILKSDRDSAKDITPHIDSPEEVGQRDSRRNSKMVSRQTSAGPEIVPLPFKVPDGGGDDSSSVATFADDDNVNRFSKRFSQGAELLRSLSHRSQGKHETLSRPPSTSTEKLANYSGIEDDRSSVAATVDEMTDEEDCRTSGDLPERSSRGKQSEQEKSQPSEVGATQHLQANEGPTAASSNTDLYPQAPLADAMAPQSLDLPKTNLENEKCPDTIPPSDPPVNASQPVALTKEALPPALPKVASSYRTNEWAKHLSNAETPEIEDINLSQPPIEALALPEEAPVVVHVKDLQQTPESSLTPPAPSSTSQLSSHPFPPQIARRNSSQSLDSSKVKPVAGPISQAVMPIPQAVISRPASQQYLPRVTTQQMHPMWSYRNSSAPNIGNTLVESPIEESSEAFANNGTFICKRENMLHSKSGFGFNPLATTPEAVSRASSDVRSSKIRDSRLGDEKVSNTARRSVVRQSTLSTLTPQLRQNSTFDSHQPRRQSSTPVTGPSKDIQLAQWRASVQQDLLANAKPKKSLDKSRSALLQEKVIAEKQKEMEQARKGMRENVLDERMRKGDMLEAHREAMRRMQKEASKHI